LVSDVDCGAPEEIEKGRVTLVSNATYYGVVALYDCIDNFKIDGYERRMCLENGSWSHAAPTCSGTKTYKIIFDYLLNI
jgi:Sushi repeat (SCR repeat)